MESVAGLGHDGIPTGRTAARCVLPSSCGPDDGQRERLSRPPRHGAGGSTSFGRRIRDLRRVQYSHGGGGHLSPLAEAAGEVPDTGGHGPFVRHRRRNILEARRRGRERVGLQLDDDIMACHPSDRGRTRDADPRARRSRVRIPGPNRPRRVAMARLAGADRAALRRRREVHCVGARRWIPPRVQRTQPFRLEHERHARTDRDRRDLQGGRAGRPHRERQVPRDEPLGRRVRSRARLGDLDRCADRVRSLFAGDPHTRCRRLLRLPVRHSTDVGHGRRLPDFEGRSAPDAQHAAYEGGPG